MFEPIEAPDVHRGPATGHTSEHGTTWQEAVSRINAGFKALFERREAATTGVSREVVDAIETRFRVAEGQIEFLGSALSDALFKIDGHEATINALSTPAETSPIGLPAEHDASDPADPANTAA